MSFVIVTAISIINPNSIKMLLKQFVTTTLFLDIIFIDNWKCV